MTGRIGDNQLDLLLGLAHPGSALIVPDSREAKSLIARGLIGEYSGVPFTRITPAGLRALAGAIEAGRLDVRLQRSYDKLRYRYVPKRLQRKRTKGWRMPEGAVYVGRPTKWGNPWPVGTKHPDTGEPMPADVAKYFFAMAWRPGSASALLRPSPADLRGKDLACWCRLCERHRDGKPVGVKCTDCAPCHADVLLELANAPEPAR